MSEHDEQVAVVAYARYHPDQRLRLLYAIPNGGWRHKATARRLRAEGVRAGVPDLCLPVAVGRYHGLYVELKAGRGRVTEAQESWIAALREQGYRAEVCYGFEEAREVIEDYLAGS